MSDESPPSSTPAFESGGDGPAVGARHVIITAHGIRTFGQWQDRLTDIIEQAESGVTVRNYRYGHFSAFAFLFPPTRAWVTRKFRLHLEAELALHPGARVDLVAHSFGTHLVGHGLRRIPSQRRPKIHTILLAGSVLKPDFPWRDLMDRGHVHRVINECGIRDNILFLNQIVAPLTGMAGRVGFNGMTGDRFVNRYHDFTHSGYFQQAGVDDDSFMRDRWTPLLTKETAPVRIDVRKPGSFVQGALIFLLNNLEPIKLAVVATIFAIPFLFVLGLYNNEQTARQDAEIATKAAKTATQNEQTARKAVDHRLLVTQIRSAQEAWRSGQFDWGRTLLASLNRTDKAKGLDPSGFEISYLNRLYEALDRVETGNLNSLLALSSGGEWLATVAPSGEIELRHKDPARSKRLHRPGPPAAPDDYFQPSNPAFSADGSVFAVDEGHGVVQLWDVATGRHWPSALKPPEPIVKPTAFAPMALGTLAALAFSPDGSLLATSGYNGYVALWDLHDARHGPGPIAPVLLLPLPEAGPAAVDHWPGRSGSPVRLTARSVAAPSAGPPFHADFLAFSPDGRRLAVLQVDGRIKLWDVGTRDLLSEQRNGSVPPGGPQSGTQIPHITAATFAPDNEHLVVAWTDGQIKARSHDLNATEIFLRRHTRATRALRFDGLGRLISVAGDGTVVVERVQFDAASSPMSPALARCGYLPQIFGPDSYYNNRESVALLEHSGKFLAIPQEDGAVGVWNLEALIPPSHSLSDARYLTRGFLGGAKFVSTLPAAGSGWVAWSWRRGSTGQTVEIFDRTTTRFVVGRSSETSVDRDWRAIPPVFAPQGKALAILENSEILVVWTDWSHQQTATLVEGLGPIRAMMFSPDGQTLAVALDARIRIVPIGGGPARTIPTHLDPATPEPVAAPVDKMGPRSLATPSPVRISCLAFASDGQTIAAGDSAGTVTTWNLADGRLLHSMPGKKGAILSLAFNTTGDLLAAGGNGVVVLCDPRTGQMLGDPCPGVRGNILSVAFRPQSGPGPASLATLAVFGLATHAEVSLWDVETGQPLLELGPGSGPLVFSADGLTLASGRDFWSAARREPKPSGTPSGINPPATPR